MKKTLVLSKSGSSVNLAAITFAVITALLVPDMAFAFIKAGEILPLMSTIAQGIAVFFAVKILFMDLLGPLIKDGSLENGWVTLLIKFVACVLLGSNLIIKGFTTLLSAVG